MSNAEVGFVPQLGLVDGVAPRERLLADARQLAADIAAGTKPRQFTLYRCARARAVGRTTVRCQHSAAALKVCRAACCRTRLSAWSAVAGERHGHVERDTSSLAERRDAIVIKQKWPVSS